jgi:hypothetical protein
MWSGYYSAIQDDANGGTIGDRTQVFAAVMTVQDMLFIMKIVESMGLQVELPMLLEIDNKGAKDLINNWSVRGRLRHIKVKQCFL